jgi:hypothetical protein
MDERIRLNHYILPFLESRISGVHGAHDAGHYLLGGHPRQADRLADKGKRFMLNHHHDVYLR